MGVVGMQILTFIVILIILCFRSYIAETFLRHIMDNYFKDKSFENITDKIHLNVSFHKSNK